MTGYALVMAPCFGCGRLFNFNPHRVPSVRYNGARQPICRASVDLANPKRVANGLEPIVPAPDAYEGIEESEL